MPTPFLRAHFLNNLSKSLPPDKTGTTNHHQRHLRDPAATTTEELLAQQKSMPTSKFEFRGEAVDQDESEENTEPPQHEQTED